MPGLPTAPSPAPRSLPTAQRLLARAAAPAVGLAAGAAAGTARAGVRGLDAAARVGRVVRNALPGSGDHWRAGTRTHLAVRPLEQAGRAGGTEHLARRMAEALAEHPDVLVAYWDQGLARLVVTVTEEEAADRVLDHAAGLAERHGLVLEGAGVEETTHPADPAGVRAAVATLAADGAGIAVALTAYALRLPPSPRVVTAAVTLLRENPRSRAWLRARLGDSGMDLLLACANAAVHGAGQTPTSLVLDGVLRACQVADTVARSAAFDAVHDQLCAPDRVSLAAQGPPRPPLRVSPAQEYAAHASAGSLLGAAATLLVKHDGAEAAEAVLAGSPKAARYGPAAFHAVLSAALARTGVLVRAPQRLRQLEMAGTVVLHPSALRTEDGEADPWAEPVLDAARRAGLRVVLVDDPALEDFTGLADQVVDARRPLDDVVYEARGDEGAVLVAARVRTADEHDVLDALRAADVALALTDRDAAVVWGADILALHGLPDVWRVLTAVPAARRVGHRAQTLARSGAALSGLLVAVGESGGGRGRRSVLPGLRHAPVDAGAALALLSGMRSALGVAAARTPHPRPRVHWHELDPEEARDRLAHEPAPETGPFGGLGTRMRKAAEGVGRHPAVAPARWSYRLGRAVRGELQDPLTPVLAVGSAASAILGSVMDALLVVGALDLNALVGGIQRLRAERALSGLVAEQKQRARLVPPETEAPAGGIRTVEAGKLRPGDVIQLKTDDVVPADARLLWQEGLEVDESALTGESLPVEKQTDPTPHAPVADRRCMLFEGTTVVAGDARAIVVDTGRALWHSVADAIAILIGGNAGEVGFGILGALLSGRAPLSTRQMLMVNLFTDLFPSMAVAVTEKEGEADLGHVEEAAGVLGDPLLRQIRHRALTTCLGALTAWLIGRFTPGTARRSSTMALCGVVGTQLVQTLLDRRDSRLVQITSLGSALALVAVVQTPGISRVFGCTPLGPVAWAGVVAAIALALAGQRTLPRLERTVGRLLPV
ncbi:P-type ATPase [Streptomyces canarius]